MEVPKEELDLGLPNEQQDSLFIGLPDRSAPAYYSALGKEVLWRGHHYADARDEQAASLIAEALNALAAYGSSEAGRY